MLSLAALSLIFGSFLPPEAPEAPVRTQATAKAQQSAPKDWIAMTESGLQIEVAAQVSKGDLTVETPYGLFRTATDPIRLCFERNRDQTWKTTTRTQSSASLLEAIQMCKANGQISGLIEMADAAIRRNRPAEIRAALRGLEEWGANLDPVPKGMTQDERVQWLWQQVQEMDGPAKLLLSGRLAAEVMPAGNGVGLRQLRQVELQRVLRGSQPLMQRVAVNICEVQAMADPYVGAQILTLSLYGSTVCRDLAARAAPKLRPMSTREYWVRALLRSEDSMRLAAAQNLVWEMPEYAAKPFAILLAATGKLAPSRFKFATHSIQVVVDRRKPHNLLQLEVAMQTSGGEIDGEYLEDSSVIKVCKVPAELQQQLQRFLAELANDEQERSLEQWLLWYKEQLK
jgi:hypothetical protein